MIQPKQAPSREEIAELEPFVGVDISQIFVVTSAAQAQIAFDELVRAGEVGFDTESKPTFYKGQKSEGPHVLQFATTDRVYIFQAHVAESLPVILRLLESTEIRKIGFGLRGDLSHIASRFGIRANAIIDLDRSFKNLGYRNAVGARSAIAILFQQRMTKSKSITTSNWGNVNLSEKQLVYAANDAYVALIVYHQLTEAGHNPGS